MSGSAAGGLVDLEKELTCSICTETLYQPLTLLDCLHTFCGSCLKEWFGWQKVNADKEHERNDRHNGHAHGRRRRRKPYVFTCPSCRALVRETRPNATVTTLLEMYLKANPDKDKPAHEKEEVAKQYTPGDQVLARNDDTTTGAEEHSNGSSREEEEDRRLLDHVREMSLRDIGAEGPQTQIQSGHGNASEQQLARNQSLGSNRATSLGHQSSLRSLLSNAYDSDEMKDEILRQIAEEGLLDDIDWDNIQDEQEDEISERIAQAYRRRRRNGPRRPQTGSSEASARRDRSRDSRVSSEMSRPQRIADTSATQPRAQASRPPASRPHLLESAEAQPRASHHHHHRRSSSQGGELQTPMAHETSRQAARSATDLSENPTSRDHRHERRRRRASHGQRTATDPSGATISEQWRRGRAAAPSSGMGINVAAATDAPASLIQSPHPQSAGLQPVQGQSQRPHTVTVACDRCGKENIEALLHYSCPDCRPRPSTFDLCLRCYRAGKGCLHWFGFGHAAWPKYKRQGSPGQPPHVLRSQKYVPAARSSPEGEQVRRDLGLTHLAQSELALQRGVFCDSCHENANTCYWHCELCNDGEWGFCSRCVNQGRHCTHPLLPLALQTFDSSVTMGEAASQLQSVDLPCTCNVCHASIHASEQRIHCPDCDDGDYDVCMPCYRSFVNSGRIRPADGLHGWRRCPHGHRTLLVQYSQHDGGPWWRSVVDGPVGGWALDAASAEQPSAPQWSWTTENGQRSFKPDERRSGHRRNSSSPAEAQPAAVGNTAKCVGLWSWVPEDGVQDELAFPKGAVVGECVDINGDFWWGVYCRAGGLFPAGYVRSIE